MKLLSWTNILLAKGDRSHIPAQYMPIFELLSADMERVKARAPPNFSRQVTDTEKRLGILFDHLNNEELLSAETLESMLNLAKALAARDYVTAHSIQVNLLTNKTSECTQWMTGVKRLIEMSRVAE
jgi:protein transport protein SEC31